MDYEIGIRLDQIAANQVALDKKLDTLVKLLSEPTKKKVKVPTTDDE